MQDIAGDVQADSTGLSAGVPAEEAMVIGGAVATSAPAVMETESSGE